MKLPHITVEYRDEEPRALGKISVWLIVGLGVHWAWMYAAMYNAALLFRAESALQTDYAFIISLVVLVAALLCYGIFLEPMRRVFDTPHQRKRNRSIAAGMLVAGMLLMPLANFSTPLHVACCFASGVATGVGSAVLLMSYGVSFSVCDISVATVCVALSLVLCSVLYLLIILCDSIAHPAECVLCLMAPLVEVRCLNHCSADLVDRLSFNTLTIPVKTVPFALHVCIPSIVFGLILGLARARVMLLARYGSNAISDVVPFILAAVVTCAVMMLAMFTQRKSNNYLFRTLVPLAAALISTVAAFDAAGTPYELFALGASYFMLEACMWVMYSDIAQRFRVSAFVSYGFGRGTLALGTLLGCVLTLFADVLPVDMSSIECLVLIAFVALTLGVSLLPTNAEMRRTLKRGCYCLSLNDQERYALDVFEEHGNLAPGAQQAVGRDDGGAPADEDGAKAAGALQPDGPLAGQEGAQGACPQGACNGDIPAAPAEKEAATRDAGSAGAENADAPGAAQAPEAAGPKPQEAHKKNLGWFKRKCSAVAENYLLSRRETEVLFMLAKGKNSAAIQEALYISPGTANTHMRHIYRKLDVHSQQELMRLVDSFEIEKRT